MQRTEPQYVTKVFLKNSCLKFIYMFYYVESEKIASEMKLVYQ